MKRSFPALAAVLLAAATTAASAAVPPPPPTAVAEVRDTLHGVEIVDPYRWLEDQESPETRAWIGAQQAYTEGLLAALPGREAMRGRFEELLRVDAVGTPTERNGRWFFTRRGRDQELAVLLMRRGATGKDEVVVDPHLWSEDRSRSVVLLSVSEDGGLVAYGVRTGGADEVVVKFRDVDAGRDLADELPLARYLGVAIRPDRSGVLYGRFGSEGPRIHEHRFGADPAADPVVFGEGRGPGQLATVSVSPNGRWALFTVLHGSAASKVELWARDLASGAAPFAIVDDLEATFTGQFAGDRLVVRTNWRAEKGRLLAIDLADPARERWTEIVPEGTASLEGFELAGGRVFAHYVEDVASRIRVFGLDGGAQGELALPGIGSAGALQGRWEGRDLVLSYSSLAEPTSLFRVDTQTLRRTVWWTSSSPVTKGAFRLEQVWYASRDGTRVPMFLLYRKGLKRDGNRPVLLYGYGGFRVSQLPRFRAEAVRWAEMGGVFVLTNLRGGSEFGEAWHQDGMLARKQNTFDDFIAAAEWMVTNGYTNASRIAISGGSNGGLLVGAAMTQRPDLFRAVICGVPLLDMLRYQRFLVARFWVPEYGSAEDPEQFRWLHAYSPYHRVTAGERYPAVLFVTGDSDTRVAPLHARKMAARLQSASGSGHPVLLLYDTKSGHSQGKPVSRVIEDETDEMMFLAWQLGMDPAAGVPPRGRATGRTPGAGR